jgi:hypothetical protein
LSFGKGDISFYLKKEGLKLFKEMSIKEPKGCDMIEI